MTAHTAKKILRRKGWGWQRASHALGYSYTHLAHTLTGRRPVSAPFASAIRALPPSPIPFRHSGFAAQTIPDPSIK